MKGDKQKALEYTEYNVNNSVTEFMYLNVEPASTDLRTETRFAALLEKLGLDATL